MPLSTPDRNITPRQSQVLALLDTISGETREGVKNLLLGASNIEFAHIQSLVSHPVWEKLHETLGTNGYRTLISIRHDSDGGGVIELGYNGADSKIQTITFSSDGEIISDIRSTVPNEHNSVPRNSRRSRGRYPGGYPYR